MFSLHVDSGRTWRGGQSQVLNTIVGLRAAVHRAVLVAHPKGELFRRMQQGHDLLPLAPKSDIDLSAAWTLSRLLKQLRPDVVHAHDPHAVSMAATAISIIGQPAPLLLASRRSEFRMARNSFSRWKYSRVDRFVASCEAVRDRLASDGIARHRTSVVYDGVDVERIATLEPANVHAELYLPMHAPVVGTVAALAPHKGHQYLIEAASRVVRHVPDARFVMIGDGELRATLEKQIREKHLERHVFLAGFRSDVLELIRSFDVFATAPLHEGMCLPLVDAMAAGKPAVATRAGGIPEVMADGRTGFLVPPRNVDALAERLVLLLEDEALRREMGSAALTRARERFTVERMVQDTADAYAAMATVSTGTQRR